MEVNSTATERFNKKIRICPETQCHEWTGCLTKKGYGIFNSFSSRKKNRVTTAHRFSYWLSKGKLTNGLVIDHICKNRKCVNIEHLREVTSYFNAMLNSNGIAYNNSIKKTCKNGHPFNLENTKIENKNGREYRQCLICVRKRGRDWAAKNKATKGAHYARFCD